MRKSTTTGRAKRQAPTAPSKPAAKRLVAVRKAAQKPVHATRSAIRRAVRSVADDRTGADA